MIQPDVYDADRRFIFNNWTQEDFIGKWENTYQTIKAGESVELPMYKAYNFCKHLVDREMNKSEGGAGIGTDERRKPYEDKTIAEISAGTDSPALANLKEKIRAEIEGENNPSKEMSSGDVNIPVQEGEFADLVEKPVTKVSKVKKAK